MYKVAVIDDEFFIRKSIILKLTNENFTVVFDSDDGKELLAYLKNNTIDLLLVDISMPLINGLDLISQILEAGHDIICCILTGYSNFEYAREAIRLGVTDYLLKPVDADELNSTVLNIEKKLKEKDEQKFRNSRSNLLEYVTGGETMNIKLDSFYVRLSLIGNLNGSRKWNSYGETDKLSIIYQGKANLKVEILENLCEPIKVFETQTVYTTKKYDDLCQLNAIIEDAKDMIKNSVILGEFRVSNEKSFKKEPEYSLLNMNRHLDLIEKFAQKKEYAKIIEQALLLFEYRSVPQIINEQIYKKMVLILYKYINFDEKMIDYDWIWQIDTREEFKNEILDNIKLILYPADSIDGIKTCRESVDKIIFEITSDYSKNYSIHSMAEKYFVNRSHLSRVFKQVTGKTFNEYVTDCKIERACELIREGHSISQVSYLVGFDDTRYFSQVFKKNVGISPVEYKKMN